MVTEPGPAIRESSAAMNSAFEAELRDELRATRLVELETLQELWSGYGTIKRYRAEGSPVGSVVIKHVRPPTSVRHPRGWNSERSHLRKLRSYEVESAWYRDWSRRCGSDCRVPRCYALEAVDQEFSFALEDLDASGFSARKSSASLSEVLACVRWLAHFHATFMGAAPGDLWEVGTYWHLDTRPDELERVEDERLRRSARAIDRRLNDARFQTLVHGDAKLANFCFTEDGTSVAAVDFQYVGGGCGMKDLAYLLGSCLASDECEELEAPILALYFAVLHEALAEHHPDLDAAEVEREWRALYAPAWADFHRFLKGWSPDRWKLNSYGEGLTRRVLDSLPEDD